LLAASVEPDERGAAFGVQRTMDNLGALIGPLIAWAMLHWVTKDYRVVFWVAVIPMAATMLMLIFRAREAPTASQPKPRNVAPFIVPARFKHYLASLLLFTLGNSSDAFLLLRARDVGIEPANLPLLWVALHIIKSTLSYPAGRFSDRVGRKALIIGGWCVYALVYLGFGYATSAWHIVVLFIIYGLFHSFTEPAEKALVADLFPDAQRGRAFGFYNAITGIGALPASLITGWIWSAHGPAAAFETGAMLALAAAVWLWAKV
jgi:MFS family permease